MNKKLIVICFILILGSVLVGCRATDTSSYSTAQSSAVTNITAPNVNSDESKNENSTPASQITSFNENNTSTPQVAAQASDEKKEGSATLECKDIIIYSLPDDVFNLPVEQIPYYSDGDIKFLPKSLFDSFSNGHQPWLGNPISVVQAQCKNLIGEGTIYEGLINSLSSGITNEYPLIDTTGQFQLSNGLDIKLISDTDGVAVVQMTVPDLGNYKITLESPFHDGILYVRKIVFAQG